MLIHFYVIYTIVPTPSVTVTALNTQTVGQSLLLQCSTTIRGITSTVDIIWSRGNVMLSRRNNISPIMMDSSLIYRNTYNISQLSTGDDDIQYWCEVMINSSPPVMATGSVILDVMGE